MEQGRFKINKRRPLWRWSGSIRAKLILAFSSLFVMVLVLVESVGILGLPVIGYPGRQRQQEEEAFRSLNLVADLKKERLMRWFEERRDDATVTAKSEFIAASVVDLQTTIRELTAEGKEAAEVWAQVQEDDAYRILEGHLTTLQNAYGVYESISIADLDSRTVIVATDDTELGTDLSRGHSFTRSLSSRDDYVSDIEMDPLQQRPSLHINHAIKDGAGEIIALLVMAISAEDIIKPMLHTGEGLGERGEALLVNEDRVILTSLKHPLADGTTARPLEYRIEAQPAALAARGEEGIIESEDYRGEPVLAAYRHIRVNSDWGWGMVVKQDRAELFAPMQQDLIFSFWMGAAGILAVVGVTVLMARSLTLPIRSLGQVANRVAGGDFTARAPVTTVDEVGALAQMFNAMVERVQHWHDELEEQVQARTVELTKEIAERQRTEDALREAELRYRTVADFTYDWEYWENPDGTLRYVSPACERITGYSAGQFIDNPLLLQELILPEDKEVWARQRKQAAETQAMLEIQFRIRHRNGESIWIEHISQPVTDELGAFLGFRASHRDITDRKRVEAEKEILIEELEIKNAELERFTYTVSHDLKSPLITIKGFLGMLEKDAETGDAERMKADMTHISDAADKMEQLLDELLQLSRIGRLVNPPEEFSWGELVREALNNVAGRLTERAVQVEIAPDLPVVYGDRSRLREVLENLVDNAVKFMGDRSSPRIEIGSRQDGEETLFYVRDNGIGIAPRYHEKIFGLFEKLDHGAEGTGIGLAIVKRIVEVHGGRIWIESEGLGKGSTFYFILPGTIPVTDEKEA